MLIHSTFQCWATNLLERIPSPQPKRRRKLSQQPLKEMCFDISPADAKIILGISMTHVKSVTVQVFKGSALLKTKPLSSFDCSKPSSYLTFQGDCEIRFERKICQSSMKLFGQGDVGLQYSLGQAVQGFQLAQLVSSLHLSLWSFRKWNFNGPERLWAICAFGASNSGLYNSELSPQNKQYIPSRCRRPFNIWHLSKLINRG